MSLVSLIFALLCEVMDSFTSVGIQMKQSEKREINLWWNRTQRLDICNVWRGVTAKYSFILRGLPAKRLGTIAWEHITQVIPGSLPQRLYIYIYIYEQDCFIFLNWKKIYSRSIRSKISEQFIFKRAALGNCVWKLNLLLKRFTTIERTARGHRSLTCYLFFVVNFCFHQPSSLCLSEETMREGNYYDWFKKCVFYTLCLTLLLQGKGVQTLIKMCGWQSFTMVLWLYVVVSDCYMIILYN